MNRSRWVPFLICAAVTLRPGPAFAAEASPPDSAGPHGIATLTIQSTPDSALVVIDSKLAGSTPLTVDSIGPGSHAVLIQPSKLDSWLTEPLSDTVLVVAGEHKVIRYTLGSLHMIRSTPFGAEVLLGDSVIGTTPFTAGSECEGQSVTLRKKGFEPASVEVFAGQPAVVNISLKRVWENEPGEEPYFREADAGGGGTARLYISGVATVISGVTAAYFKIKADDRYQQYLNTNDGSLLAQTHRLDTEAGIALAVTQIGLGLFTYFIFTK